jgi:hypothetical protein
MKRRDATIEPSGLAGVQRMLARAGLAIDEVRGRTLPGILLRYFSPATGGRLRRMISKALALTPRGFVPNDVLIVGDLSARLRLEWRTRDLHPWDRDLPPSRRAQRFRDQTLVDTDAAIERLFRILPEMDSVDIRVLEPDAPNRLLLAGTVAREDLLATRAIASPGMRLRMMGIRCDTRHGRLEPLS